MRGAAGVIHCGLRWRQRVEVTRGRLPYGCQHSQRHYNRKLLAPSTRPRLAWLQQHKDSERHNHRLRTREREQCSGESMGVNWNSGLIYWKDHTPSAAQRYSLSHLHPFVHPTDLAATDKHPARTVQLYVSFGMHTFTRSIEPHDEDHEFYCDNREVRTFCPTRYQKSVDLPGIFRSLETHRCEFARGMSGRINYVTVETAGGERYAAFFDLRLFQKVGPDAVHLMVQSAYALDPNKPAPGKGRIHFHTLLGHTLRGTTPRSPP